MENNIDIINNASNFISLLSLWLAIVIGIIASILVLRASSKMGGGLFGAVLKFIGSGMLLVALGSISLALSTWFPQNLVSLVHTVFFSLGYICMVLGANKLLKGIMS